MNHVRTKPIYAICEQQKGRSACASVQSNQHLCYSLLSIIPLVSKQEIPRLLLASTTLPHPRFSCDVALIICVLTNTEIFCHPAMPPYDTGLVIEEHFPQLPPSPAPCSYQVLKYSAILRCHHMTLAWSLRNIFLNSPIPCPMFLPSTEIFCHPAMPPYDTGLANEEHFPQLPPSPAPCSYQVLKYSAILRCHHMTLAWSLRNIFLNSPIPCPMFLPSTEIFCHPAMPPYDTGLVTEEHFPQLPPSPAPCSYQVLKYSAILRCHHMTLAWSMRNIFLNSPHPLPHVLTKYWGILPSCDATIWHWPGQWGTFSSTPPIPCPMFLPSTEVFCHPAMPPYDTGLVNEEHFPQLPHPLPHVLTKYWSILPSCDATIWHWPGQWGTFSSTPPIPCPMFLPSTAVFCHPAMPPYDTGLVNEEHFPQLPPSPAPCSYQVLKYSAILRCHHMTLAWSMRNIFLNSPHPPPHVLTKYWSILPSCDATIWHWPGQWGTFSSTPPSPAPCSYQVLKYSAILRCHHMTLAWSMRNIFLNSPHPPPHVLTKYWSILPSCDATIWHWPGQWGTFSSTPPIPCPMFLPSTEVFCHPVMPP